MWLKRTDDFPFIKTRGPFRSVSLGFLWGHKIFHYSASLEGVSTISKKSKVIRLILDMEALDLMWINLLEVFLGEKWSSKNYVCKVLRVCYVSNNRTDKWHYPSELPSSPVVARSIKRLTPETVSFKTPGGRVIDSTYMFVARIGHGRTHNGQELWGMFTQSPFLTKQLESMSRKLHFMAAYSRELPRSIFGPISSFATARFLFQMAWGVSEKYAVYVIHDSGLEKLIWSRRDPTSPQLWQRVTVLWNWVEVLARSDWMSIPAYSPTPPVFEWRNGKLGPIGEESPAICQSQNFEEPGDLPRKLPPTTSQPGACIHKGKSFHAIETRVTYFPGKEVRAAREIIARQLGQSVVEILISVTQLLIEGISVRSTWENPLSRISARMTARRRTRIQVIY